MNIKPPLFVAFNTTTIIFLLSFQIPSKAANFAKLKSDICNNLSADLFCVDEVIKITQDWMYDDPKLDPLMINDSWEHDTAGFGADSNGRRFYEITDRSYQINFSGNFEEIIFDGWEGSLVDENKLRTMGDEIPASWRSTTGYVLPPSASVFNFSREYTVQKRKLQPGELGCPSGNDIEFCLYNKTFLGASVDLGAQLSARGSIANIDIDDISDLTINGKILRNTNLLINDNPATDIASDITNEVSMLTLVEDGGLQPKNIKLKGKVKFEGTPEDVKFEGEGEGEADFIYEEDQEVASIFTQYLQEASSNFIDAGQAEKFELTLNDSISMTAEITGNSFASAEIFTENRLQNPLSSAFTVFEVVKEQKEIPEPSTLFSLLALGVLGGASILKRELKLSKLSEKELEKVS